MCKLVVPLHSFADGVPVARLYFLVEARVASTSPCATTTSRACDLLVQAAPVCAMRSLMRAACSVFLFKGSPACLEGCAGGALERVRRPSPCRYAPCCEGRAASAPPTCSCATWRNGASPAARAWRKAGCSAAANGWDAIQLPGAAAMTAARNVVDRSKVASPRRGSQQKTFRWDQVWVDSARLERRNCMFAIIVQFGLCPTTYPNSTKMALGWPVFIFSTCTRGATRKRSFRFCREQIWMDSASLEMESYNQHC